MSVNALLGMVASLWLTLSNNYTDITTQASALLNAEAIPVTKPCRSNCKTSEDGVSLIAYFEGYSPVVYEDAAGYPTIGYGHLILRGEKFTYLDPLSARKLLKTDIGRHERPVNRMVKVPLQQNQFDAIVSFTFNLGEGALQSSTLLKRVNAERHEDVPNQLNRWIFAGGKKLQGLVLRREAEAVMYSGSTSGLLSKILDS